MFHSFYLMIWCWSLHGTLCDMTVDRNWRDEKSKVHANRSGSFFRLLTTAFSIFFHRQLKPHPTTCTISFKKKQQYSLMSYFGLFFVSCFLFFIIFKPFLFSSGSPPIIYTTSSSFKENHAVWHKAYPTHSYLPVLFPLLIFTQLLFRLSLDLILLLKVGFKYK